MASIQQKMMASASAIFTLAGDLYDFGSFREEHVEELFAVDSFGGLGCLPTIAKRIV